MDSGGSIKSPSSRPVPRVQFVVQAIDVDSDEDLKDKYRMRIPVLELEANGDWKELPFQPPRLTADALGKRLEKHINDITQ